MYIADRIGHFPTKMEGARFYVLQLPLVIVDSSVSGKMSTITSNSTITGEIHAKIDNWSAQSVHYNERFHYYGVHYYERRLYIIL